MTDKNDRDIARHLLAPCGEFDSKAEDIRLDVSGLIVRLLLFDTYILDSTRLLEIPHLAGVFGYDGLLELLRSGTLEIHTGTRGIALIRNRPPGVPSSNPGAHTVRLIQSANPDSELGENLTESLKRLNLPRSKRDRLDARVRESLRFMPPNAGVVAMEQLERDLLRGSDEIRRAIAAALRKLGIEIGVDDFELEFQLDQKGMYRHATDLGKTHNLNVQQVHEILENAILAVGALETRLEEMRELQAISGFRGDDLPMFDAKLDFLTKSFAPEEREASFRRVLDVAGVPSIPVGTAAQIDVEKLLKIRQSAEHREFLDMLPEIGTMSDEDIRDIMTSFGARVSTLIHGPVGRVLRFLTIAGLGVVPQAGPAVSIALGTIDTFLLKKVIPYRGPAAFINQQYPSLFENGASKD